MGEHTRSLIVYGSSGVAVLGGLTANEWAALIGALVAISMGAFNIWAGIRRDQREKRLIAYQTGEQVDRRHRMQFVMKDRREKFEICRTCPLNDEEVI
jgi:hypothetical protein